MKNKMKKLLMIMIALSLVFVLAACKDIPPSEDGCNYISVFRVEVIEELENNIYVVGKYEYTTQAFYQIYTEQELEIGEITRVAVYETDDAIMFNELICIVDSD